MELGKSVTKSIRNKTNFMVYNELSKPIDNSLDWSVKSLTMDSVLNPTRNLVSISINLSIRNGLLNNT